ncbi:hypothetical protein OCH239_22250 [Roseivivax halodurans JCM 10272]|uniref:DUF4258 domain-containing protein n=1 Tax=Roseivivax halodurans JCM 10272 TaxID=1449350 RepID=X7E3B5_9RHOB|nr:hypothetical protein OCH239_22250 [Roseivivax halodurans JCM 10272]
MTPAQFEAEVHDRARFPNMVRFTDHVIERMVERGITRPMVLRALRRGTVDGPKLKWDATPGNWIAPMVAITAGTEVCAICAIREGDLIVTVVTAY